MDLFWSSRQPLTMYAGEPAPHAQFRARLAEAVTRTSIAPFDVCWAMHQVTGTGYGNSRKWHRRTGTPNVGWSVESCGSSVPNTHWHIVRNGSLWLAWRVHRASAGLPTPRTLWADMDQVSRHEHLVAALSVSPIADNPLALIDELARHAEGTSEDPNTYPFAECAAIGMTLGMRHPDAHPARAYAALGGFDHLLVSPEPSVRFRWRRGPHESRVSRPRAAA